jgi:hypothetical protein
MFERLFLASLALSVIAFFVGYEATMDALARQPGAARIGFGSEIVIGWMVASTAIYLLLWFLIARKASNVAKWFLIAFTAIGVATLVFSLATIGLNTDLNSMLGIAYYVLAVAAIVFLFKPDAITWLTSENPADSADPASSD